MYMSSKKRSLISHAIRGMGNLKYYGKHPGVFLTFYLIIATAVAGLQNGGLSGFIGGLILGSVIYIPMLLWGSIRRSIEHDAYVEKRERRIEEILMTP